jgi:uncharacterized protein involved in exopolysaccharide biosynthesis
VGYNLISVTYTNTSPRMAQRVVQAVVDQYGTSAAQFSVAEAKQLLLVYQQQLQQAQDTSNKSAADASAYLVDHPGATVQRDAQYSILVNGANNAQAAVNAAQANISQVTGEVATIGSTDNSLYTVVDAPTVGQRPVSRTKTLLLGVGIGLAIGLLASVIFIIIVMRRDRSAHSAADLLRMIEAPVLMQLPYLPVKVLAQTVHRADASQRLLRNG